VNDKQRVDFVKLLREEATGIEEYGHSLRVNIENKEEIFKIVNDITNLLERLDCIIRESYDL